MEEEQKQTGNMDMREHPLAKSDSKIPDSMVKGLILHDMDFSVVQ